MALRRGNVFPRVRNEFISGGVLMEFTFLTTLTFLFSLPGWEKSLGGFPALSGSGGFLLKDVVLLGAALFTLGDSLAE